MKFQVTRPFSITVKGRRTDYKLGQRIGEAAYRRLPLRQQQEYFQSARRAASNTPYTAAEMALILDAYVEGRSRKEITSLFSEVFGSSHTPDSVNRMCGQLETLDVEHPASTEHVVSDEFRRMAVQFDAARFA
jgi:hypothetical protein